MHLINNNIEGMIFSDLLVQFAHFSILQQHLNISKQLSFYEPSPGCYYPDRSCAHYRYECFACAYLCMSLRKLIFSRS